MLYQRPQQWTPLIKTRRLGYMLLNLSLLSQLEPTIQQRALELAISPTDLRHRFEDAMLMNKDLNQKVDGVILPLESMTRPISLSSYKQEQEQEQEQKHEHTPYQYLRLTYNNLFHTGVHIPWDGIQRFHKLISNGTLDRVSIYNFHLNSSSFHQQFPILRQLVNKLHNPKKAKQFHLTVKIEHIVELNQLQKELIQGQYPIQHISISSNILELLLDDSGYKGVDPVQIAWTYTSILKKYVSPALSNILQTFSSDRQWGSAERVELIGLVYEVINVINEKDSKGVLSFKRHFNSGVVVPEILMGHLIHNYTLDEMGDCIVRSQMDYMAYKKLYQCSQGQFEGLK